jgi:hypothetical protein
MFAGVRFIIISDHAIHANHIFTSSPILDLTYAHCRETPLLYRNVMENRLETFLFDSRES